MHYLSACCILKDEDLFFPEWLVYHSLIGVEHFYLYDNESRTPVSHNPLVQRYISAGRITLLSIHGRAMQIPAYNHCLENFGAHSKWIAFIDIDEFLYIDAGVDLRPKLAKFETYASVAVNWRIFNSAGHLTRPDGLVLENYQELCLLSNTNNLHIKSIVQPQYVSAANNAHCFHERAPYRAISSNGLLRSPACPVAPVYPVYPVAQSCQDAPVYVSSHGIYLNHYLTKSQQDFEAKQQRGRADVPQGNTLEYQQFYSMAENIGKKESGITRFAPQVAELLAKGELAPAFPLQHLPEGLPCPQVLQGKSLEKSKETKQEDNQKPTHGVEQKIGQEASFVETILSGLQPLLASAEPEKALTLLCHAMLCYPGNVPLLLARASIYRQQKDFASALLFTQKAMQLETTTRVYAELYQLLLELEQGAVTKAAGAFYTVDSAELKTTRKSYPPLRLNASPYNDTTLHGLSSTTVKDFLKHLKEQEPALPIRENAQQSNPRICFENSAKSTLAQQSVKTPADGKEQMHLLAMVCLPPSCPRRQQATLEEHEHTRTPENATAYAPKAVLAEGSCKESSFHGGSFGKNLTAPYHNAACLTADYLDEWLSYHSLLGVEYFILPQDFSAYNSAVCDSLLAQGRLEFAPARLAGFDYNIEQARTRFKWLAYVNINEFFCLKRNNDLRAFLSQFDAYAALRICYHNFLVEAEDTNAPLQTPALFIQKNLSCITAEVTLATHFNYQSIIQPEKIDRVNANGTLCCRQPFYPITENFMPSAETARECLHSSEKIWVNRYITPHTLALELQNQQEHEQQIKIINKTTGGAFGEVTVRESDEVFGEVAGAATPPATPANIRAVSASPALLTSSALLTSPDASPAATAPQPAFKVEATITRYVPELLKALTSKNAPIFMPETSAERCSYTMQTKEWITKNKLEEAVICLAHAKLHCGEHYQLNLLHSAIARRKRDYSAAKIYAQKAMANRDIPQAYEELFHISIAEKNFAEARAILYYMQNNPHTLLTDTGWKNHLAELEKQCAG